MRKSLPIIISLFALFVACKPHHNIDTPPKSSSNTINWDVIAPSGASTKSTIKSFINGYDDLQYACTPSENGGLDQAIGFYAENESNGIKTPDIFGAKETRLIYKTKPESPYNWNYFRQDELGNPLPDLKWESTKLYHIRAYYPQSLTSLINPTSSPRCMVIDYNTHTNQEDLMVAYNRVYTVDTLTGNPSICINKDPITGERIDANLTKSDGYTMVGSRKRYDYCGYDQPFDLTKPIPLFFEHTLAAIRVRFKFNYNAIGSEDLNISDELLNCYFTNIDDNQGLHTVGSFIYGNETLTVGESREQLESWWKTFSWKSIQSSKKDVPFYRWGLSQEDIDAGALTGTTINRHSRMVGAQRQVTDSMAVAYSYYPTWDINDFVITGDPNDEVNGAKSTVIDDNASPLTMSLKHEAPYFNINEGWILIIPQKAVSGLRFNFTTRNMGLQSTLVPPITTTTNDDGDQAYLPGHRYTYTLTIEPTNIHLSLSIVPWNNIYASETISF